LPLVLELDCKTIKNIRANYGPAVFDRTHRLIGSFNHPQFDDPAVTPGNDPQAGKITSASDFGFTQTERVIQLGLKYSF
jgi:hypothetical protein